MENKNPIIIELYTHDYSCNRYLIYDEDSDFAVLIDPGLDSSVVLDKLKEINKRLGAILITHAHYDHVEAVADLKEATNAPVYMGEKDIELLSNGGVLDWYFAKKLKSFIVDNRLIGGDLTVCGLNFKVIPTPGHTHGSLTYIIGDNMFTGDAVFHETYGRTDLPGSDFSELVDSAKRLFSLQGDYKIYCGHGKITTLSHEKQFNPIIKNF